MLIYFTRKHLFSETMCVVTMDILINVCDKNQNMAKL